MINGLFNTYIQFIPHIDFIQYQSDKVMGKLFKFLANLKVLSVILWKYKLGKLVFLYMNLD